MVTRESWSPTVGVPIPPNDWTAVVTAPLEHDAPRQAATAEPADLHAVQVGKDGLRPDQRHFGTWKRGAHHVVVPLLQLRRLGGMLGAFAGVVPTSRHGQTQAGLFLY